MQIKVKNDGGKTCAWVVDPSQGENGETSETVYLEEGQEITFTATDVHSAEGIQVGEVTDSSAEETAPDEAEAGGGDGETQAE